jgi:hypothetical protein
LSSAPTNKSKNTKYLIQPSEKDAGGHQMADLRPYFFLAVNIISTDDLNNFVAVEKPRETLQGF